MILSIDQGTTGTSVHLVNKAGQIVASADREHPQIYPKPGWVEHRPEDIWQSVLFGIDEVLKSSKINPSSIRAIGITNQRETVVVWDRKTGQPVMNAIVWQCRRTTDFCVQLKKRRKETLLKKRTGLVIDPYFSASKIRWILDNVKGVKPRARSGELAAGTIDTFLLWRLTGGGSHKTDVSNASRTQLMNISKLVWDAELLKLFGVPKALLPEICESNAIFGHTKGVPGLPDGIPIAGMTGDQQAALFGQAAFRVGEAKCTFGTGSFLLMNTGAKQIQSKSGLLTTVAWKLAGDKSVTYALEGGAFVCGAAVQWLRDELRLIHSASEVESLAREVDSAEGVQFVPAFVGLGAPHWSPEARGMIMGLTRGSGRGHIARAVLEAMALQNVDILLAMQKDLGKKLKSVRVDGGAVENDLLMQIQADYLGVTVSRPKVIESTTLGAAFLAGLGVGFWKSLDDVAKAWRLDREFKPSLSTADRKKRLQRWLIAINRTKV